MIILNINKNINVNIIININIIIITIIKNIMYVILYIRIQSVCNYSLFIHFMQHLILFLVF